MKWKKPNGNEIEVNDEQATIDYAKSLGWEPMEGSAESAPPEHTEGLTDVDSAPEEEKPKKGKAKKGNG